ncbi:hypothetical protein FOMPIDRAFT_1129324 [Fomitopsis schrenkii]|uniref:DUF6533 domain-containing protein n=1 Tax=Fomitopsis schrenkii TaxID=2126942 RepID=S8DWQ3_FOMSC|nr:hypothetical protein FOMPIDRAFT_1129324 [Fomitopsis schrenkii]
MPHKLTLALYAYERCSTLDQEVHYIWHYRLSGVSILYMFLQVTTVAYFLLWLSLVCIYVKMVCFGTVLRKCKLVITLLRVYAVSGGGRTVSVLVFALSMVTVAYTIVPSQRNPGITVGLATGIIADAIVLIVTWHKTYNMVRLARSANVRAPLAVILLRDGQCPIASGPHARSQTDICCRIRLFWVVYQHSHIYDHDI